MLWFSNQLYEYRLQLSKGSPSMPNHMYVNCSFYSCGITQTFLECILSMSWANDKYSSSLVSPTQIGKKLSIFL